MQSAPTPTTAIRAVALALIALATAAAIWQLRPAMPTVTAPPDTDVVLGCAWLAWALAGYLAVVVAATALGHAVAATGAAGDLLTRLAPAGVRRLVDAVITFSLAAAVLGSSTAGPAAAATGHQPSNRSVGTALDWPGLSDRLQPHPTSAGLAARSKQPHDGGLVVVRPGDSLWAIAARHLGPTASDAAITLVWHEWYAANRRVIGADPNLIVAGQRLRPPARSSR